VWIDRIETLRGPRYLAILACLEDAIRTGQLRPRTRLPPQRRLAELLGLTVGTAGRAYAIAAERGWITGETGRGTFVCDNPFGGDDGTIKPLRGAIADIGRLRARLAEPGEEKQIIDLALPAAASPEVPRILARALSELFGREQLVLPRKYVTRRAPLRYSHAAARWLSRLGLQAEPHRIVVTANGNQGLAAAILCNVVRGEAVLTAPLTYSGLKVLAFNYGFRLEPVESDDKGILPEALEAAATHGLGRIVYLQSELNNPTAQVMPLERRRAIADIARRFDLVLLEDCAGLAELSSITPLLATLAPEHTFLIASAAKSISVAVSVGYVVAPPGWGERFELQIRDRYFQVAPLGAEIMTHLVESDAVSEIAAAYRATIARRRALLRATLPLAQFQSDPRSFFVWLALPSRWRSEDFASACALNGVTVAASGNFTVGMTMNVPAVRLSLVGTAADETFIEGLKRVGTLMEGDIMSAGMIV
jgi:DNA-binding transcriptional MocR family regulator